MEILALLLMICWFRQSDGRVVPYKAIIEYKGIPFCSGSVVEALWILTAAKCVEDKTVSYLTVRLHFNNVHEPGGTIHSIKSLHIHPKYDPSTAKRGIALLRLGTPLKLSAQLSLIPLVKPGYGMEEGTRCTIPAALPNMTDIKAKLWTREKCQSVYPNAVLNLTDDALCAKIVPPNNGSSSSSNNNKVVVRSVGNRQGAICVDATMKLPLSTQQRLTLGSPLVCEGKQVGVVSRVVQSPVSIAGSGSVGTSHGLPNQRQQQQHENKHHFEFLSSIQHTSFSGCEDSTTRKPTTNGHSKGPPRSAIGVADFFTDVAFGNHWISSHLTNKRRKPNHHVDYHRGGGADGGGGGGGVGSSGGGAGGKRRGLGKQLRGFPFHRNGAGRSQKRSSSSSSTVALLLTVLIVVAGSRLISNHP
ncbi:uncharacterized protein LOC129749439 isoform X2 [Uranotaenia lowii]|uniref:uncharacterized protein LOC129749439 isoform X2 n=1 Tax=Uranotaenia lowii TaxID=190385 RepID=UPI002478A3B9|nr:uncharacterized protein LOC129749439 isoform X2 [Uranotaenia lowii]